MTLEIIFGTILLYADTITWGLCQRTQLREETAGLGTGTTTQFTLYLCHLLQEMKCVTRRVYGVAFFLFLFPTNPPDQIRLVVGH